MLRTPSTSIAKIMVSSSVLGFPRIGMLVLIRDEYRSDTAQVPTVRLKRLSRLTGRAKSLLMTSRRLPPTFARPLGPQSRSRGLPTSLGTRVFRETRRVHALILLSQRRILALRPCPRPLCCVQRNPHSLSGPGPHPPRYFLRHGPWTSSRWCRCPCI